MVLTRQKSQMDLEKNKDKNGVNHTGADKSRMKAIKHGNISNTDSEDDHDSSHSSPRSSHSSNAPVPLGLAASSSIKVTLKKKSSYCSSSSRESTQSFEVVKNIPPAAESPSASSGEENENQKADFENKKTDKQNSGNEDAADNDVADDAENEKEFEADSENDIASCDSDIEIVEEPIQIETEKENNKGNHQSVKKTNSVTKFKSEEVPQNAVIKKEEKVVKHEDKEDLKHSILENNALVLKSDEVKDLIKEQHKEYKLINVRSFNDLAAPQTANLINIAPPPQIDSHQSFISQNGTPYPQYTHMCDLCGSQFDSLELLNEHKKAMKHYKCTFKDCEHLVLASQQEFLDHQSMVHNVMPSPVQQLAHQVQCLPTMGFDRQLQPGVSSLQENLQPPGVPNMYTHNMRMPNQVPMQRPMRPMGRPNMNLMLGGNPTRGRNMSRAPRGRPLAMNSPMMRGPPIKRPQSSMSVRHQTPPPKRVATDRNSFSKNSPTIVKSLSESLTKSITSANKSQATPTQQDVVNLFSKRGLTISTVDTVNNISIPAGLSLNSAVSIIPTSPAKTVDTVDLTGPDTRPKKFWPCEICSKTYLSAETLYEHVSIAHKSVALSFRCNLCSLSFPNWDLLNRHKQTFHKTDVNPKSSQFVIPLIDLNKSGAIAKMNSMGITNYLPVEQLEKQCGHFAFPIMSIARPGSMDGMKFTDFFNLGCIRKL